MGKSGVNWWLCGVPSVELIMHGKHPYKQWKKYWDPTALITQWKPKKQNFKRVSIYAKNTIKLIILLSVMFTKNLEYFLELEKK